ncbi:DUF3027 domain-containing protein [Microterricola viridarii]|uniref:DUF3027 domain-containing protein n=1 Tax=Microterricola viridarii TaxID=412690 RepID=A0A0Y0QDU8_9MICO|nr:DUF3027 domain-containing protein [Microterricola viridarii]AMB60486.1 hypothetical protein AWU67_10845 [Microterricola viridarii]
MQSETDAAPQPAALSDALETVTEPTEKSVPVTDEVLLAAVDMARAALLDFTPPATIGRVIGHVAEEDHVLSLLFECRLAGYPGWHWTVTLSRISGEAKPTVLESELMPGEGALLAPEWVPWSERLADYQAAQLAHDDEQAESDGEHDDDDHDDEHDDDDEGEDDGFDDDYTDEPQQRPHSGDIDGLDIDHLDGELTDDESDDDDDDDDDESDDDDDDDESDDDDDDESDDDDDDDDDESDDDDDDDEDDESDSDDDDEATARD